MPKLTFAAMSAISGERNVKAHQADGSSHSLTERESSHRGKRAPYRSPCLHRMAARISYAERFSGYAPLIASAMSGARLSYAGDGVSYQVRQMTVAPWISYFEGRNGKIQCRFLRPIELP
jgi:hypothetical protein